VCRGVADLAAARLRDAFDFGTCRHFCRREQTFCLDAIAALAIGLAAVWLLSNYLRRQNGFVTFLCVCPSWPASACWLLVSKRLKAGILKWKCCKPGSCWRLGVLASAAALSLGGLVCRGRYRPLGLYAVAHPPAGRSVAVDCPPFFLFALMASGGALRGANFFIPVLAVAAGQLPNAAALYILSSASPFFRERLKALLHVKAEAPPVMPPLPEAGLKT
jgi:hypothetical protein